MRKKRSVRVKRRTLPAMRPVRPRALPKHLARLLDDEGWGMEVQWSGHRRLFYIESGRCWVESKTGKVEERFHPLCEDVASELSGVHDAILDGAIIAPDEHGHPVLRGAAKKGATLIVMAVDLLWLNGEDLRPLPLVERQEKLKFILPARADAVHVLQSDMVAGEEEKKDFLHNLDHAGLGGFVLKRLDGAYARGAWYQVKRSQQPVQQPKLRGAA